MIQQKKKKFLVETNGLIGSEVYTVADADEAARIARRAEIFYRLIITNKKMSGKEASRRAEEAVDTAVLPGFVVNKVKALAK